MKRRTFLGSSATAIASPSFGFEAPIAAIFEYEKSSGGHIGLHAENVATGAKLAWRADQRFALCSTFKASLAACVLARVDRGQDDLDRVLAFGPSDLRDWHAPVARAHLATGRLSVGEMCEAAVEQSDNTCANILLARIGGASAMTAFWRDLGDPITRLDDPEPDLNRVPPGSARNTTTPESMARILRQLVLGSVLSQTSRDRLTSWLVGCRTGADRLRAGVPSQYRIGNKTGNNGNDAAGDIAVVWTTANTPIVVCTYTRGGSPTTRQFGAVFAGIGRVVVERLS